MGQNRSKSKKKLWAISGWEMVKNARMREGKSLCTLAWWQNWNSGLTSGYCWSILRDNWNRNRFSSILWMINGVFVKISFSLWSSHFSRFFDFVDQYGILDCRPNHESLSLIVLSNIWMIIDECVLNHLQSIIIPSGVS